MTFAGFVGQCSMVFSEWYNSCYGVERQLKLYHGVLDAAFTFWTDLACALFYDVE
jgi:hypothetical protein